MSQFFLITCTFPCNFLGDSEATCSQAMSLSKDEQNVLRYCCGYVGMRLHKKFLKVSGQKAAQFVECLSHMRADGTSSSLLNYTKEWVNKINRGCLFEVSDETFALFVAIELTMRNKLTECLKKSISVSSQSEKVKSDIIEFVCINSDVQLYWNMISIDICVEEDGIELLKHIVSLWLNIRGFSISKAWMEEYKKIVCISTQKTKSLRKELKRKQDLD